MKKYFQKRILGLVTSVVLAILYGNLVRPNIEKPLTILGFFVCTGMVVFSASYVLFAWRLRRYSVVLMSAISTLSITYLIALNTIRTISISDILIVGIVVVLSIQLLVVRNKQ